MPKVYNSENVLTASIKRINFLLDNFEKISVSFSGGKDSSVLIQLLDIECRKRGRKFDVLFIDLEADYDMTLRHVEEIKRLESIRGFDHVCLPIELNNGVSALSPKWVCWDISCKDKWVRPLPPNAITEVNHKYDWFYPGMGWYEFLDKYAQHKSNADKYCNLIGLRADESYWRFKAVAFSKNRYKGKNYILSKSKNIFNAYPIYDYSAADIWGCVAKFGFMYNKVYDYMTKYGLSINQQRVSQPFGHDQKTGLKQIAKIEPETWGRIVNRLSGVNMSALYCKTSLLGHNGSSKPNHMTWQEYAVFLIESIGLYDVVLMRHYHRKINIFFNYYKDKQDLEDIPEDMTKAEMLEKSGNGKWITWKRIAICLEKNDFSCRTLTYGLTKEDKKVAKLLKKKWGDKLGIQENTKELRMLKKELENE